MLFELLFQFLDPSQLVTSVAVAFSSIVLQRLVTIFLPAFLSFLASLAVMIILFVIFLLSLVVLVSLPPIP